MKDINNDFVPYEIALELKNKGFDEVCFGCFVNGRFQYRLRNTNTKLSKILHSKMDRRVPDEYISAPLWQQVIDWFDEVHKIRIDLTHANSNGGYTFCLWRYEEPNNLGIWKRLSYVVTFTNKTKRNIQAVKEALKLIK